MKRLITHTILFAAFLGNVSVLHAQLFSTLTTAATFGNAAKVEKLIREGADVNERTEISRYTALILASRQGHADVVRILIDAGANLDASDKYGYSSLINASNLGQTQIVAILIKAGANVDMQGKKGRTAIYYAKKKDHRDIIRLLENASSIYAEASSAHAKTPDRPSEPAQEDSEIDLSFFSNDELKEMYKQAITIKDSENINLIQKELSNRAEIAAKTKETNPQYRGAGDPLKGLDVAKSGQLEIGKYYALIIGIDEYQGAWAPFQNAVGDAKAVEDLLSSKYKFDHFRMLYNEMATRKNIMKEMTWLVNNVNENDNVFIYYSGHGDYKTELTKGYWVPVEAETTEIYELISNSAIQTYLNGIKSKHTLLISDACFSGDIFRGTTTSVPFEQAENYYKKVHKLKSRQAFTSGGIEPVMDGGRDGHSVFAYYILKMLNSNEDRYYDAGQLYNDIKIPVTNNSDQTPLLQPVKNTADEGGQFIFIKK